jgi:class 3 adenylate cyclase
MDIEAWLRSLALERYSTAFQAHDIDATLLPELTGDDLKELGVLSIGHRRKLLLAIAALQSGDTIRAEPNAFETGQSSPPASRAVVSPTLERRQITVLFCDLIGSAALSQSLDSEDLRDLLRQIQVTIARDQSLRGARGSVSG